MVDFEKMRTPRDWIGEEKKREGDKEGRGDKKKMQKQKDGGGCLGQMEKCRSHVTIRELSGKKLKGERELTSKIARAVGEGGSWGARFKTPKTNVFL